jgi:hypothetical protein
VKEPGNDLLHGLYYLLLFEIANKPLWCSLPFHNRLADQTERTSPPSAKPTWGTSGTSWVSKGECLKTAERTRRGKLRKAKEGKALKERLVRLPVMRRNYQDQQAAGLMTLDELGERLSELDEAREDAREAAHGLHKLEILQSEDIANAIVYAVTQPERASVNEILIRPTQQPV